MRPLIRDARGLLGEHEGSVREVRGAVKVFANHMIDKNVDVFIQHPGTPEHSGHRNSRKTPELRIKIDGVVLFFCYRLLRYCVTRRACVTQVPYLIMK